LEIAENAGAGFENLPKKKLDAGAAAVAVAGAHRVV
jgi:hypothetical protein